MPQRLIAQLVALALLVFPAAGAAACEYCVREVGFVPLHGGPYRVVIAVPPETSDDERDRLVAEARAALGPSNVVVSVGTADEGGLFADTAGQATGPLPAAVVYAPGEQGSAVLAGSADDFTNADTIGALTRSPAREGLAEAMIDGYATVLLVEGTDADANAAARELAEGAIQRINAVKSGFDRVIEVGPALRIITADDRSKEHWLLWSLGIDSGDESLPSVAVLYGKGRRLGDVLTGNTLTDDRLFTLLSYVARDCECDLDRTWLYGTTIPLVWDDALRRRAYESLGFDPESAATRAAVARILERGPGSSGAGVRDPFLEDSGTNIGIPGLTIHDLDDEASTVPPAVGDAPSIPVGDDAQPAAQDDTDAPEAPAAPVATDANTQSAASGTAQMMKFAGLALAGLVVVTIVGSILITKSRGSH